jgi:chitodextrinase
MPPPRKLFTCLTIAFLTLAAAASAAAAGQHQTSFLPRLRTMGQPAKVAVNASTQSSITISWQGSKVNGTRYNVYLNGALRASTTSTAYTFSGLSCGKSYSLGVSAFSAKKPSLTTIAATGPCVTAAPPATDSQSPSPPGSVSVSSATSSAVTLTWTPSTDNVAVAGYQVYVGANPSASTTSTRYGVGGLQCGSAYQLSVDAFDSAGNRSAKASVTAATAACPDTLAPQPPGNLYEVSSSLTSIGASWSRPLDNIGVTSYAVYLDGTLIASPSTTGYLFTGLTCGRTYTVAVEAYDAAGNVSPRTSMSAGTNPCSDTTAPAAPADVQWISATATTATVSWTAATDNVGVAGYTVYLAGIQLQTASNTGPLTISSLTCATSYKVAVDAYDAAGNHSPRTQITVITTACPAASSDTSPPTSPANPTIGSVSTSGLTVSWTASADNVAVTGYRVFVNGSQAGSTAATSYPVSGLTCGTSYTLAVEAFDAAGNTSSRPQVTGSTSACTATPPPASPPAGAQLYVATGGSDSTCTRGDATKPCATFQRAYQVAQLGDTVQVAAGNYPAQLLTDVSGKTSAGAAITFQASGTVNLADLALGDQFTNPNAADNLKFVGFHGTSAWDVLPGANNITFDHVQTTNIYANGVNGYTVTNSDFGNCTVAALNGPCDNFKIEGNAQHVLLDHDTFHDFRVAAGSTAHFECLFFADAHYVTISNSTFTNCEYYDIFVQTQSAGIGHVNITGNHFDVTWAGGQHNRGTALNISDRGVAFDDWAINSNTFTTGSSFIWDVSGTYTNFRLSSDSFGLPADCMSGAAYVGNTWTSGTCNS